jgi:hypothetical protein
MLPGRKQESVMIRCPLCHHENEKRFTYCQKCGAFLDRESSQSDITQLLKAFLIAILAGAVFYKIFPVPQLPQASYIYAVLTGHVICYSTVIAFFWAMALLGLQYRRYRQEKAMLLVFTSHEILTVIEQGITPANKEAVLRTIRAVFEQRKSRKFVRAVPYKRLCACLTYLEAVPKKETITEILAYYASLDLARAESRYILLKFFTWALPILGFIGTVVGITDAVAGLSTTLQQIASPEMIGHGLQAGGEIDIQSTFRDVTGGLAVAFNTTFLALILVLPLVFLNNLVQKMEQDLLLGIEHLFITNIAPRLYFGQMLEERGGASLEGHLRNMELISAKWLLAFEPILEKLTRSTALLASQLQGMNRVVGEFSEKVIDENLKREDRS